MPAQPADTHHAAADTPRIVPVAPAHRDAWDRLYRGYMTFYERPEDAAVRARLWAWLMDPAHEVEGVVALDDAGTPVGLAHFRRMPSPLRGADVGFLDDLYVDPAARGRRLGEALIAHVHGIARERGWPTLRWLTQDHNYRARALYDRVAEKTLWNLYEMQV